MFQTGFSILVAAALLNMTSSMDGLTKRFKRSDDSDPYAAVLHAHAQELTALQARLQALENRQAKQASFHAVLGNGAVSNGGQAVAANAPVRFDRVKFLTGGSTQYDPHTGIFTVTTPGIYQIAFQLFPQFFADILVDIVVNGVVQTRSRSYDQSVYQTTCSCSAAFHLKQGDKVWVQTSQAGNYWIDVNTFFSGVLVTPDP